MDFGLSDEQDMIVSTVRRFVETEIYPHEAEVERTGQVPLELAQEIKQKVIDLGFYACNFPEEVGGAGLSHLDFTLVERELGRGSMALTHFFGRPQNILMACTGDQRERYLMPAVRGDRMDALAMTEPEAGSDVRGMKCTAVREGDDWIVNGTKHFISGAEHADFFIVFVATGVDETPKGPKKRITCFLVDRGHPGFVVRAGYNSVSHRGYKNFILEFDDCRRLFPEFQERRFRVTPVNNRWFWHDCRKWQLCLWRRHLLAPFRRQATHQGRRGICRLTLSILRCWQ